MLYREAGQFKTTYADDQAIFPIIQDRVIAVAIVVAASLAVEEEVERVAFAPDRLEPIVDLGRLGHRLAKRPGEFFE